MPDEFGASAYGEAAEGIAEPGGVREILVSSYTPPADAVMVESGGAGGGETFGPAAIPATVEPPDAGRGILGGAPTRDDALSAGDSGPTIGAPTPGGTLPTATFHPGAGIAAPPGDTIAVPRWAWIVGASLLASAALWFIVGKRKRD